MSEPSLAARKRRLRDDMRRILDALPTTAAATAGLAIRDRLIDWPDWRDAAAIAFFSTLRGEVDTRPMIDAAQRAGKIMLFPRMTSDHQLEFAVVEDLERLSPGRHGVLEPDARCRVAQMSRAGLVFVPGLAFDREGARLGRGAGYYDRALAVARSDSERPRVIGLGFACQLVDEVPSGSLDVRMDAIVTDSALITVAARSARNA